MDRRDNYAISAAQARRLFLNYDHEALARKLKTKLEGDYLYAVMLAEPYRIHRTTGDIFRFHGGKWEEANSFGESLTLLDLVCDSRPDRHTTGRFKNMQDFGLQFHSNLLSDRADPWALHFQQQPEAFARACQALGGEWYPVGDVAYSIEIFDGLRVLIQLWFGDAEFLPQLRWLWDENALMYLKYETMWYSLEVILNRLEENMK